VHVKSLELHPFPLVQSLVVKHSTHLVPLARHFGVEPEQLSPPALQTAIPKPVSSTHVELQSEFLRHSASLGVIPPNPLVGGWHSIQTPTPVATVEVTQ